MLKNVLFEYSYIHTEYSKRIDEIIESVKMYVKAILNPIQVKVSNNSDHEIL